MFTCVGKRAQCSRCCLNALCVYHIGTAFDAMPSVPVAYCVLYSSSSSDATLSRLGAMSLHRSREEREGQLPVMCVAHTNYTTP